MLQTTSLYAALLALGAIALLNFVIFRRAKTGISILHGDDMELALRIRRHGNFVESVPLALILMGLAEMRGAPVYLLHGMGVVLVLARLSHAVGLSVANPSHPLRILGVLATQIAMLGAIVFLFWSLRG